MFGDKYLRITDKCSIFVDELHEMQDYNSKLPQFGIRNSA